MRIPRSAGATLLMWAVLLASSGAFESFTTKYPVGSDVESSPVMKIFWALAYFIVLLRLIPKRHYATAIFHASKSFLLLPLLAVLSVVWSIDPWVTMSKSAPLLLSTLIGLDIAITYPLHEQLQLFREVLASVIVVGVIVQVFLPGFVPIRDLDPGSAWNGIVSNKNDWARLIVLTGVVLLSYRRGSGRRLVIAAILIAIIFALLITSRSATGLIVMAAMLLFYSVIPILRGAPKARLFVPAVGLAAILSLFWVMNNLNGVLLVFGKDSTFTGRVPIWNMSLSYIAKRPLLGYGYAAFWSSHSQPAMLIREEVHWPALPHAHNGYIDFTLALGGVGLFVYFIAYLIGLRRSIYYYKNNLGPNSAWPLAYFALISLYQLTESSIVAANQIFWILYSSVFFSLALLTSDHRNVVFRTDRKSTEEMQLAAQGK